MRDGNIYSPCGDQAPPVVAMIIDFHAHIYPEKIARKAVENVSLFYGGYPMNNCNGTAEDLLACGASAGVDRFVVFSAASNPSQVVSINNFIAESAAANEQFTGFGTLHPDMEDPQAEIDRMIALGLKGVKLHADMQGFKIDDEKMMDIYALLEGRLPVTFHCGDFRFDNSHPARLARVLDAFPGLTVIAAHFGGWLIYDLALEYLRKRRCYLDISSSFPMIGLERGAELISIYGAGRLLFATDYPMWNPAQCVAEFNKIKLSTAERDLISYKNAMKILQL
jgi:predicted TIM-barrel fold metal-dependent hydrolase